MNVEHWALSPEVLHLNHGSYGGCQARVIAEATRLRRELEAAPMKFFGLAWQGLLDHARETLAAFVGAPAERLVFVPNATHGVAIAIASCRVDAGDEILTTNHTYRAVKNQLARLAEARGARVHTLAIPLPFDPDAMVAAIEAAVTPRTRLVVLDHVTSPTALIFPLERIVPGLVARGIQVVIDGAHAPGQIELDISALGPTYYAGNNHKWLCAPKATGFLVAHGPALPLVTSHGASPDYGPANRLHAELDWAGTADPTAHLCVPAAIAAVADWPATRARNHALVLALRDRVIAALGGDERHHLAPAAQLGCMAAILVRGPESPFDLTQRLLREDVELPIVDWPGQPLVRISAHLYNDERDAEPLIAKLKQLGISLAP